MNDEQTRQRERDDEATEPARRERVRQATPEEVEEMQRDRSRSQRGREGRG